VFIIKFASILFNVPPSLITNSSAVSGTSSKAVAPVILDTSKPPT